MIPSGGPDGLSTPSRRLLSPKLAFLLVSLALGQLGDGLNIFQGIYLVGKGWNEFVLYAETNLSNEFSVYPEFYYLYVGMTWDNGFDRVLDEPGAGRGLLF